MRPMRQRQRRSLRVAASDSMATRAEADHCTLPACSFLLLISATCASSCKAKLLLHLTLVNRDLTRCHQDATEA